MNGNKTTPEFESSEAQALGYAQVMTLPPHGPFAYLTAGTLATRFRSMSERQLASPAVASGPPVPTPTPATTLRWMQTQWELSHMRQWPAFYAAAELRMDDIESL